MLTIWLVAAATSDAAFSVVQAIYGSWAGLFVLFCFTLALFYHFCNGIRHLRWDAGKGFELPEMHRNGRIVIASALILTVACWVIFFLVG